MKFVTDMDVIQCALFISLFYQSSNLGMEIESKSAIEKLHIKWMDEN